VYSCSRLADLLHAESAEVLATYGDDFYQGMPALTRNSFGKGHAYYVASDPDDQFLDNFYGAILQKHAIAPVFSTPQGVEITIRHKDNRAIVFVLNHNHHPVTLDLQARTFHDLLTGETASGSVSLDPYDVRILVEQNQSG
jgi:beta-galactosidase